MGHEINAEKIGWYFTPTDQNLIEILRKWIQGERFPELSEVQFLEFEPHQLADVREGKVAGGYLIIDITYVKTEDDIIGVKRHYLYYNSEDIPTVWIAYEYRLSSSKKDQKQSLLNGVEHAVIRLFMNDMIDPTARSHFTDQDIIDMLVKRNQGHEFPEFGIIHFFHKEPYQFPALKSGERRIYIVHFHDVYAPADRWATPTGRWKTVYNTPLTFIKAKKEDKIVGSKMLRRYYDYGDKPTVWNLYEYYTADQVINGTTGECFALAFFKSDSENSAPEKAPDLIATPLSVHGESLDHTTNPLTEAIAWLDKPEWNLDDLWLNVVHNPSDI